MRLLCAVFVACAGSILVASEHSFASDAPVVEQIYFVRDLLVRVPSFDDVPKQDWGDFDDHHPQDKVIGFEGSRAQLVKLLHDCFPDSKISPGADVFHIKVEAPEATQAQVKAFLAEEEARRFCQVSLRVSYFRVADEELKQLDPLLARRIRQVTFAGGGSNSFVVTNDEAETLAKRVSDQKASSLTLFNGQRAYTLTVHQQAYVADYALEHAPDGDHFVPKIKVAETGIIPSLRADVAPGAHRASVSGNLLHSVLMGIDSVPFAHAPAELKLKVQQPKTEVARAEITCSLEDDQTILVGLQGDSVEPGYLHFALIHCKIAPAAPHSVRLVQANVFHDSAQTASSSLAICFGSLLSAAKRYNPQLPLIGRPMRG